MRTIWFLQFIEHFAAVSLQQFLIVCSTVPHYSAFFSLFVCSVSSKLPIFRLCHPHFSIFQVLFIVLFFFVSTPPLNFVPCFVVVPFHFFFFFFFLFFLLVLFLSSRFIGTRQQTTHMVFFFFLIYANHLFVDITIPLDQSYRLVHSIIVNVIYVAVWMHVPMTLSMKYFFSFNIVNAYFCVN